MRIAKPRKSALPEQVVRDFLAAIAAGKIRSGEKLPPERELASQMGVSRPCLREALRALDTMNVIEIRHGAGAYVTTLQPDLLLEPLGFVLSLDRSTLLQLFEARMVIEVACAQLAAQRIRSGEVNNLEAILLRSEKNAGNADEYRRNDMELHEAIVEYARNPILRRFLASIVGLDKAGRKRMSRIPGMRKIAIRDHALIVKAVRTRDAGAAGEAMLHHLLHIQLSLKAGRAVAVASTSHQGTEASGHQSGGKHSRETAGQRGRR